MGDSSTAYYSWASSSSSSSVATGSQGPMAASPLTVDSAGPQHIVYFDDRPVVDPPQSRGATDMFESRRSIDYTQTNATVPWPAVANSTPPPHPHSDPNVSPTKDPCQCFSTGTERKGRNLVVCIDGTANKFGTTNTNVIELYSQILREEADEQLTYYDSGIGTYARPSWRSWTYLTQVIHNKIDLVIAWNLEKVIIGAYRWLSNQYRKGDKIFLFGFSRGAFQVRALAGMIETVGLILPGNEAQIPFAYELYANYDAAGKDKADAPTFKKTFSRTDVRVHFVGVWDTVSSVGLVRGKKMLPRIVECCNHVCYFRHGLALDERRVKFLPEYVHEGSSHKPDEPRFSGQGKCTASIKEVWFAGTHSDVGGGSRLNADLQLGDIPLLWMRNEAIMAGLRLKAADINWKLTDLERGPTPSLVAIWKILEQFPVRRLSYKGHHSTSRRPHRGKSRKIVEGQMIHASVLFRPGYKPSPAFPKNMGTWPVPLHWDDPDRHERLAELAELDNNIWEKDLFDHTTAKDLFERLKPNQHDSARILERIAFMASSEEGRKAIWQVVDAPLGILEAFLKRTTSTEGKLIRISAATAFSYLIPGGLKDPDSKTNLVEITGKLRDFGCLDLVISLIYPGKEKDNPEDRTSLANPIRGDTVTSLVTEDIEKAIKLEAKAQKVRQRAAQQRHRADKKDDKTSKDRHRSRTPSAQVVTPVAPAEYTPPETVNAATFQQPYNDLVDKSVARKAAEDLRKEEDKLRLHACLAISTFVDHDDLRKTIIERNVFEALVNLVEENSVDMSSVAAQALLHMLVSDDVAEYIVLQKDLTTAIINIALNEDTKMPVSAARILEELAEHDCTRRVMAESEVPKKLFELLKAGDKNFIKASRLNALCEFADYDDLRPALLDIQLVPFLVKRTGQKDKHKRKACLTALITLAEHDEMRAEIFQTEFIKFLMKQLGDKDTDRDAQSTLVSLCTHENFRSHIIQTDFLKILVYRLGKKKYFDDAQYSLNALVQYEDVRDALLGLPFISTLENAITEGGVILDDLGNAMFSFCLQHDILQAIMQSQFVEILLDNARKGTVWGLEVASCLLQSDFLKIPEFRKRLMEGGLVAILNDIACRSSLFALTYLPAILSCTGIYDDMREAMLASGTIKGLIVRMRYVSISSVVFKDNNFHDEIEAKFEEFDFDIDKLDHVSLSTSLSRIFRLGHENIHMIRSFLFMMAAHPRGFVRMLKYGASDDW